MRCSTSSRSKVESTAWPASYRTAIFCILTKIVDGILQVTEVPEVTSDWRGISRNEDQSGARTAPGYFHLRAVRISPYAARQNQKSMSIPRSRWVGWCRAAGGNDGRSRKYATLPSTMARNACRRLRATVHLDTGSVPFGCRPFNGWHSILLPFLPAHGRAFHSGAIREGRGPPHRRSSRRQGNPHRR